MQTVTCLIQDFASLSVSGAVSSSVYLPALIITISIHRNNTNATPTVVQIIFVSLPPLLHIDIHTVKYEIPVKIFIVSFCFLKKDIFYGKFPIEYILPIIIPHTIAGYPVTNVTPIVYGFSFTHPRCGTEYVGLA